MSVAEFWELTPAETFVVLEAWGWRVEQEQKGRAWLAWHIAALQRMKRLPPLSRLVGRAKPKVLTGEEKERVKREHAEMVEKFKAQHPDVKRET